MKNILLKKKNYWFAVSAKQPCSAAQPPSPTHPKGVLRSAKQKNKLKFSLYFFILQRAGNALLEHKNKKNFPEAGDFFADLKVNLFLFFEPKKSIILTRAKLAISNKTFVFALSKELYLESPFCDVARNHSTGLFKKSSFAAQGTAARGPEPFSWLGGDGVAKQPVLKNVAAGPKEPRGTKGCFAPLVPRGSFGPELRTAPPVPALRSMGRYGKKTYFLENFERSNQKTCMSQRPAVVEKEWIQKGDFICESVNSFFGELALGKNVLIAYMPWQGYNFEDAIFLSEDLVTNHTYTTLHIEKFNIKARNTHQGYEQISLPWFLCGSEGTQKQKKFSETLEKTSLLKFQHYGCLPPKEAKKKQAGNYNLNQKGIVKLGTWVEADNILVGKNTPLPQTEMSGLEKLFYTIFEKTRPKFRDTSLRTPKGVEGRVVDIQITNFYVEQNQNGAKRPLVLIEKVDVYIVESRCLKVGDKMAGRHGNKGIISNILPRQDMPYLPDGTPIDVVLNPLGVPSRMNVGQVLECLLGLAGKYMHQQFKIRPFDEIYGNQASRSFVYSKLYLARLKTGQKWLFQPSEPGKTKLFDGQTGYCFDQSVTVGYAYMLKLIHLVDEKIHARSVGPYNSITQQPVKGRRRKGGQRLGEMEIWALEGFGVAYTLHEIITVKSDDITGREKVFGSIVEGQQLSIGTAEAFQVLIHELRGLGLNLNRTFPLKKN